MSLHTPFFFLKAIEDSSDYTVCHNCDGSLNFMATDTIDKSTARLLIFAIADGERRMAKKMRDYWRLSK